MIELKNTFLAGMMNKDVDSRLMKDGQYRNGLNIKVGASQGEDIGAVENVLSNEVLTSLSLGTTVNTVGAFFDNSADMIYWFVTSDTGDYVVEYDTIGDTAVIVLTDTSLGILNFNVSNLITGVGVIVDSDTDKRILVWTDDLNPIRAINIATAKAYTPNVFTSAQISLVKRPPLSPPTLTMGTTASSAENNISERFLRFSHRYRYADGEVSALSPFTETGFLPGNFSYNYSTASNESMVNQYNKATVGFDTGLAEVVAIDIVMKESNSETVYLIQAFNKAEEGWSDSTTQTFDFSNNKIYTALAADQLKRLYDAVPLSAKALELIGNRVLLGNYTEGYNITTSGGAAIKIDFSVAQVNSAVTSGTPAETMKSNRDYEIGIVYLDDDGRMSTVLTSPTNTTYVTNANADDANVLQVTIVNTPPSWATRYRFFLKQTRVDYDTIVPSIFYQDGVYVWLKVEADERDKFSEGDFLYAKSDSTELLTETVQTRVLEIVDQPQNFLDTSITATVEQIEGWYFKVKPVGYRLNETDFTTYTNVEYAFRSRATDNNISVASGASGTYYELPIYYGSVGLDDVTITGTYTASTDIRYQLDINVLGLPDSYRWSDDDGASWSADIPITGAAQPLGTDGLSVTFAASTGHVLSDNWIISAKSHTVVTTLWNKAGSSDGSPGDIKRRAIVPFHGKPVTDETIKAGATITIDYDDTISDAGASDMISFTDTFISTASYANLEEWFFGDNIIASATWPTTIDKVIFRRGTSPGEPSEVDGRYTTPPTPDEPMMMLVASSANYSGSDRIRVNSSLTIVELNNNIIFETIPLNLDESLFYEIGRTYDITGGFHVAFDGSDQTQTGGQDAILLLPVFNAFSWGNGFESYKVKDRFNAKTMGIDTRPSLDIENYRQNKRIADLTYSKPFEQSTNFNGINEFNLSTSNFLAMDDRYGSIQKLFSADTNVEVYQEDKVHMVLYQKDVLLDADGNQNIKESTNVLGNTPIPWAGEYGISTHPESHAFYGNMRYWTDVRRGVLLRRSQDGITEITSGMSDYIRDAFRDNPTTRKFGAYDLFDEEYVLHDAGVFTLAYSESVKGFPSFYSFSPQWMGSLNNNFYSFANGQLWRHYDDTNATRNSFYGTTYDSTIKLIVNQGPSDIKVVKSLVFEGNKAWGTTIKSYLNDETVDVTQSTLTVAEFLNKEGKFYGYVRRNELTGDFTAKNAYGIGEIASIASLVVTMGDPLPNSVAIGDEVYDSTPTLIGTITAVDRTLNTVTLSAVGALSPTDFILGLKDGRIEGSAIRGYNFEIDLVDATNLRTELFALTSNVFKSWPS